MTTVKKSTKKYSSKLMKNFAFIKIATFGEGIERDLHPDKTMSFETPLGYTYNLGNVMRFMYSKEFQPEWLSNRLSKSQFEKIIKGEKTEVPYYWEKVSYLLLTYVSQRTDVLVDIMELVKSEEKLFKAIPVFYMKNKDGGKKMTVTNKLIRYGEIVTVLLNTVKFIIKDNENITLYELREKLWEKFESEILEVIRDKKEALRFFSGQW